MISIIIEIWISIIFLSVNFLNVVFFILIIFLSGLLFVAFLKKGNIHLLIGNSYRSQQLKSSGRNNLLLKFNMQIFTGFDTADPDRRS